MTTQQTTNKLIQVQIKQVFNSQKTTEGIEIIPGKNNNVFSGRCALKFSTIKEYTHYLQQLQVCLNPFPQFDCHCSHPLNACPFLVNIDQLHIKEDKVIHNFLGVLVPSNCLLAQQIDLRKSTETEIVFQSGEKMPVYEFFIVMPTCINQRINEADKCRKENQICIRSVHRKSGQEFLQIHPNITKENFMCNGFCFHRGLLQQACFGQAQHTQKQNISNVFEYLSHLTNMFKFQNIQTSITLSNKYHWLINYIKKYLRAFDFALNELQKLELACKNLFLLKFFLTRTLVDNFFNYFASPNGPTSISIETINQLKHLQEKTATLPNIEFSSLYLVYHLMGLEKTLDKKQFISSLQLNLPLFFLYLLENKLISAPTLSSFMSKQKQFLEVLQLHKLIPELMEFQKVIPPYILGYLLFEQNPDAITTFESQLGSSTDSQNFCITTCFISERDLFLIGQKLLVQFPELDWQLRFFEEEIRCDPEQVKVWYFAEEPYSFDSIDELVEQFTSDQLLLVCNPSQLPKKLVDQCLINLMRESNLDTLLIRNSILSLLKKSSTPLVFEMGRNNQNISNQVIRNRFSEKLPQPNQTSQIPVFWSVNMGNCCSKHLKLACVKKDCAKARSIVEPSKTQNQNCKFCHCDSPKKREVQAPIQPQFSLKASFVKESVFYQAQQILQEQNILFSCEKRSILMHSKGKQALLTNRQGINCRRSITFSSALLH